MKRERWASFHADEEARMIIDGRKQDDAPISWHIWLPPLHPWWQLSNEELCVMFCPNVELHKVELLPEIAHCRVEGELVAVFHDKELIDAFERRAKELREREDG